MSMSLVVCSTPTQWKGQGKAFFHPDAMPDLGITEGDVIEIRSGLRGRLVTRAALGDRVNVAPRLPPLRRTGCTSSPAVTATLLHE